MDAAAQLFRAADVEHAHFVAVFLAEQGHRAMLDGVVKRHQMGLRGAVFQDFLVDDRFHGGDLLGRHRRIVAEVETGLVRVDQRALLRHVAAQHFAQGLVHQVRGRVVADGARALGRVDFRRDGVAHLQHARLEHAVVAEHVGLDFQGIADGKAARARGDHALVAHLAARFRVERRGVEHDNARVTGLEFLHGRAGRVQRDDLAAERQLVVADEFVFLARVLDLAVLVRLAALARQFLAFLQGRVVARLVERDVAFAADVGRQVRREAIGFVQGESGGAVDARGILGQLRFQHFHARFQGFAETLFLGFQHVGDVVLRFFQLRIGAAHLDGQVGHQLVEERFRLAQLVAMAQGAADDAAQHIRAAFAARNDAVDDHEGGGADVVGDHAQRLVFQVRGARFARGGADQMLEQVDFIVRMHVLQHGGQALHAHARVDARLRQLVHDARFVAVELHEHEVPDFNEAVAVFVRRARRAARNVGAVVVEDFRAWTAWARVRHLPEIVRRVARTLVVADADDALDRHADFLGPDVVRFVIFDVDGDGQLVGRQAVHLGQQFPGEVDRVALEIVAEAEVAQHFKEGMVARRVADVFQVVVLAAGAHAALHGGGARVRTAVHARKHVLELHHAAVRQQQGRIVAWHQGAGTDDGMALGLEKFEELVADFR